MKTSLKCLVSASCAATLLLLGGCDDQEKQDLRDKLSKLEAREKAKEESDKAQARDQVIQQRLDEQKQTTRELGQSLAALAQLVPQVKGLRAELDASKQETKDLNTALKGINDALGVLSTKVAGGVSAADLKTALDKFREEITKVINRPPVPPPTPPPGDDDNQKGVSKAARELIKLTLEALCVEYPPVCAFIHVFTDLLSEEDKSPGKVTSDSEPMRKFKEQFDKLSDADKGKVRSLLNVIPDALLGAAFKSPDVQKLLHDDGLAPAPGPIPPTPTTDQSVPRTGPTPSPTP